MAEQEHLLGQQDLELQQQQTQQQGQPEQCVQAGIKLMKQQLKAANVQLKQATNQVQEQKDGALQLKRELSVQRGQADKQRQLAVQAQADAASAEKAYARIAQQLEQAQLELNDMTSEQHSKVTFDHSASTRNAQKTVILLCVAASSQQCVHCCW